MRAKQGGEMIAAIPLLIFPVLAYNLFALIFAGGLSADAQPKMEQVLFKVTMASRVEWAVHTADLFVFSSLIILFIELLRATHSGRVAIINHSLSMLLFIACLVEFLLKGACATSAFFMITAMVLLDVLAGFIVSLASARGD